MAYRLAILDPTESDAATVTVSSETGEHVGANVQHPGLYRKWRTTSDTEEDITFDFGASAEQPANALYIGPGHNLSIDATIEVRGSTDNFAASDVLLWGEDGVGDYAIASVYGFGEGGFGESGFGGTMTAEDAALYRHIVMAQWDEVYYRAYKVVIRDPTNADTYIEVPRIAIGTEERFEREIAWIKDYQTIDPSRISYTAKGSPGTAQAPEKYVQFSLNWPNVSEGMFYTKLDRLWRRLGAGTDFFINLDADGESAGLAELKRFYGRWVSGPMSFGSGYRGSLTRGFRQTT